VPAEAAVGDLAEAARSAPVTDACDADRSADAAGVGAKATEGVLVVDPPVGSAEDVTEAADAAWAEVMPPALAADAGGVEVVGWAEATPLAPAVGVGGAEAPADAVDPVADTLTVEPTAGGVEDAEAGAKTTMGSAAAAVGGAEAALLASTMGVRGVEDVVALEDEETGCPSWARVSERPRLRAATLGLAVELEPPLEPPLELAPPR
jgi:hypothetical protein